MFYSSNAKSMKTTAYLTAEKNSFDPETRSWKTVTVAGTISLEIDVERILSRLGQKALRNKTGRSVEFGGLLKATVIR